MEHHFQPTAYHTTFGPHEPVLRVADGDTICTSTLDCWGRDAKGVQAWHGPNPQTGPFHVEGAEPGDALVVHIDRLAPSRDDGFSNTVLQPNVVDPEQVRTMPTALQARWRIDRGRGVALLTDPDVAISSLAWPLSPMLGCIGVAPRGRQAISTATSGPHGGNMDYNGFGAGATVYLPVFEPGALLFVGDGHALQGAGEVLGQGIEVSMEVQLTVRLLKGWRIGWPRGEVGEYILTVGNARPLDQALQHATTEMLGWLREGFGLDARAAHVLLGHGVEYDIGNVIDPAYTVVCKLLKRLLEAAGLRARSPWGPPHQ
ncbi:MAG: acetamidase/formamidase family protein [Anaerolineae bacterium]|nr:acetamidase/formamidase family protein [Anaerolineae bacterium]